MKLNYFGRLIKNARLIEYTDLEIKGYKSDRENLPSYRQTTPTLLVHLQVGHNLHEKELPISMLEEPFNKLLASSNTYEGITILERMAHELSKDPSKVIANAVPMEMLTCMQPAAERLYHSNAKVTVVKAFITANPNHIVQIVDTVRSKLLELVMEVADVFGYEIEIKTFKSKLEVNNQIINNITNQIMNIGDGNITNTGDDSELSITAK